MHTKTRLPTLLGYPNDLARTLSTLVTNDDDQEIAQDIFKDWIKNKNQP